MRVRVDTLGCRVNRYDSAALRGELAARGWDVVDEGATGFDVYVLNSCTVTQAADAEARGLVARVRRQAPGARVVVTGCWAETAAEKVTRLPVDLVVGNTGKPELAARIDALVGREPAPAPAPADPEPFPDGGGATRFFFKVQEGCDVRCSFCIIPDARGHARSLDPERVVETVRRAGERGFREVILAGIHLGAYGRDQPHAPTLAGLVRRVLRETRIERVRLGSLEPWGVRPELLALLRHEPRFLPMLHLPLQSGSERILRAMRRPITAARYLAVVEQVFAARPELALYLDVLVGFPGESDADFAATVRFLDQFPWTKLHVFPYSARPGTPAAALPDQVPPALKKERVRLLVDASDARFCARMAARVGSDDEVLVEQDASGHTRDHFPCRVAGAARGALVRVHLGGLTPERTQLLAS
ncbi:MAG TPA: tRNA (N(6)-L-threonylcarbamoyladenosine(37)-C(2))-methylthiotransferase MtaB [Polyangia bacterium]|nr:tRNA (N(6)-L-threonylcarbamoyladenosine(37)-C(2))-methylthiotransferase MtaB [Polyangia bacterium]